MDSYKRKSAAASRKTLSSIKDAQKDLSKFLRKLEEVPTQILLEETARAKREMLLLVPVRSHDLQKSIVCEVSRSKSSPGFYAYASSRHRGYNYAYDQHENPNYKHDEAAGKEYKFIEKPFLAAVERIERRVEEELTYD